MTDLIKKIILTAAVLFSGIAPVLAHKDTSFNSPHKLELKPASFAEPGYQLAKSYWLGGADIDLGFKGDDDATVCQSRGYTTGSCGTNQEIVSYCGAGNQYHRCDCNDRIYRYDDITCGQDAYPDMSDEYVCKKNPLDQGKSDRCICYAADQRWIDGSCVFYCSQDSHCADDEICITSTGQCEFKDCEIYGCDGGQVCYNHYCEVPNCVNGGTSCVQGEKCDSVSKQCVEDPNTCPSGYQESACSDKQVSDGSNHTTSSGKVCYACRAKTCDDLNCDSVRQTCNSAALICVDKAGCSSGDSTTACKSDQKPLGTYVADNGDTCYQCQNMTCQEQLEAAGYGIDGAFGTNGTSVITKNITLNNFTNNKKYISLKGLSFSQCKYTSKPTVTVSPDVPFMNSVSLDNLIIKADGVVLKGTANIKDTEFQAPFMDISRSDGGSAKITFDGTVSLAGYLSVYSQGKLTVLGSFENTDGISILGTVNLAYPATFKTPKNINVDKSATLSTEFSGVNSRGSVVANNIISSGYIDFYRKNVEVTGDVLLSSSGDASFCNRRSRPGDCLLSLSDSTLKVGASIYIRDGGQFESSSSTTTISDALLAYQGGNVKLTSSDLTAYKIYSTVDGGKFEIHGGNIKATYETAVGWNWENGTELANEYATIRMDKGAVFTLPNDAYLKLYNGGRLCYIGDARFYFAGKGKYYCADKDCKYTNTTNYRGAGVGRKDGWRTITNKSAGGNWNDNRGTCTGKN